MPVYRMHGTLVHLKLAGPKSKHPRPCVGLIPDPRTPPGQRGKPPMVRCLGISSLLCDWPLEGGGTCDAPLCPDHATAIGPDRHLCPLHAPRAAEMPGQKPLL